MAAKKAQDYDLVGAIQAIEMFENVFTRLIEQWEQDFKQAERLSKRGGGDKDRFKKFRDDHLQMQSRVSHTKAKFRMLLNWLREVDSKMNREMEAH